MPSIDYGNLFLMLQDFKFCTWLAIIKLRISSFYPISIFHFRELATFAQRVKMAVVVSKLWFLHWSCIIDESSDRADEPSPTSLESKRTRVGLKYPTSLFVVNIDFFSPFYFPSHVQCSMDLPLEFLP